MPRSRCTTAARWPSARSRSQHIVGRGPLLRAVHGAGPRGAGQGVVHVARADVTDTRREPGVQVRWHRSAGQIQQRGAARGELVARCVEEPEARTPAPSRCRRRSWRSRRGTPGPARRPPPWPRASVRRSPGSTSGAGSRRDLGTRRLETRCPRHLDDAQRPIAPHAPARKRPRDGSPSGPVTGGRPGRPRAHRRARPSCPLRRRPWEPRSTSSSGRTLDQPTPRPRRPARAVSVPLNLSGATRMRIPRMYNPRRRTPEPTEAQRGRNAVSLDRETAARASRTPSASAWVA